MSSLRALIHDRLVEAGGGDLQLEEQRRMVELLEQCIEECIEVEVAALLQQREERAQTQLFRLQTFLRRLEREWGKKDELGILSLLRETVEQLGVEDVTVF